MTTEDQRIAIAQACPTIFEIRPAGHWGLTGIYWVGSSWPSGMVDPLSDLNAMHEAEKILTEKQKRIFRFILSENSDGRNAVFSTIEAAMCHATASQRAEAFLKCIGKWEE